MRINYSSRVFGDSKGENPLFVYNSSFSPDGTSRVENLALVTDLEKSNSLTLINDQLFTIGEGAEALNMVTSGNLLEGEASSFRAAFLDIGAANQNGKDGSITDGFVLTQLMAEGLVPGATGASMTPAQMAEFKKEVSDSFGPYATRAMKSMVESGEFIGLANIKEEKDGKGGGKFGIDNGNIEYLVSATGTFGEKRKRRKP